MTDTALLKQAIERSGFKISKLMEAANIKAYSTLRSKMSGETEFTVSEIKGISRILQLTAAERDRIFFADNV